jgi:hypothetical protein
MRNKILMVFSLMLLVLVLIGVTIVEPLIKNYSWISSFQPMIVIMGFFTFIVAVALFIWVIISNLKK